MFLKVDLMARVTNAMPQSLTSCTSSQGNENDLQQRPYLMGSSPELVRLQTQARSEPQFRKKPTSPGIPPGKLMTIALSLKPCGLASF
ncbi:hypothetical protein C7476_13125 [Phyllobacterium bourgognense]|uniref:Uncharacterized protein n=1 Tax=Phyllobacterium bourgognense TaxID=314236 RepID=A0A368YGQ2_9HYPH|nr:hypothetical protein C7476_13125 [Phyllobacterium bourgognense]